MIQTARPRQEGRKRKWPGHGGQDYLLRAKVRSVMLEVLSLHRESFQANESFLSNGGSSISAIEVRNKCKADGIGLSVEAILSSSCLRDCCNKACIEDDDRAQSLRCVRVRRRGGILSPPTSGEETEMQQIFTLNSQKNPGTNIIRFSQAFETCDIPTIRQAWTKTIQEVDIFRDKTSEWKELTCATRSDVASLREMNPIYSSLVSNLTAVTSEEAPQHTTIIWDVHHALIDGYSMKLMYQRIWKLAKGQALEPTTPFSQVAQDLKQLQQDRSQMHKDFWSQQVSSHPQAQGRFHLSPSSARSDTCTSSEATVRNDILRWCQNHNVTLAALHYAAWSLVLSSYTDSDTVVFGAVMSGRSLPIPGVEDSIGPLVNTLPFYVNIDRSRTGIYHVQKVFEGLVKLQEVEASLTKDGFIRDFDSAIAMEIEIPSPNDVVQPVDDSSFTIQTGIPLSITFNTTGRIKFHYQNHLEQDVGLMRDLYKQYLSTLMTSFRTLEHDMPMVSQLCYGDTALCKGNLGQHSTTRSSVSEDLVTRFEEVARQNSSAVALYKDGATITYSELDARAGRLAHAMQDTVKARDVVCICADRSFHWLIGVFAVLKLGAIYAPVNLDLPARTREINYQTAKSVLFLASTSSQTSLAPPNAVTLVIDDALEGVTASIAHRVSPRPSDPAYLCFTSGSTGTPKAVLCRHDGLVAFQSDLTVRLYAQVGQKVAQVMSPAFDGSIHEIFSALCFGATLVLPASGSDLSHLELSDSAILTPSLARVLQPQDFPRLNRVYLVGEPVPQSVCDKWASSKQLFNMYGPTESTCGATIQRLRPGEPVTIGSTNPSSRVYILDCHLQPCPPNVIGDLYTAGVQVAEGYLGLTDLNAQLFRPDPFCPGERMYYTGDRGYWTHSWEIQCCGRRDRQVKLNGFRLDLNLLEEQILEHSPQLEAVGLAKKNSYLVAAVVPASVNVHELSEQLATHLPRYSLPRHIFAVDRLPRTAVAKIDYSAIQALAPQKQAERDAPLKGLEDLIEATWRDILNLDSPTALSRRQPMLEVGGDSLAQLALSNRLTEVLGRRIRLKQVIEAPTIHDLACELEQNREQAAEILAPSKEQSISPLEADWVQKYQAKCGSSAFSVSVAWELDALKINCNRLAKAWNAVLARNKLFSSYFVTAETGPTRLYHSSPPRVELFDSIDLPTTVNKPFQIDCDHLVRVIISPTRMLLLISHLLCDLTTVRIVLGDVASLYTDPSKVAVEIPSGSSRQHAVRQSDFVYWSEALAAPPLRSWTPLPPRRSFGGRSDARWLPRDLLPRLTALSRRNRLTLHQVALAAVALSLQYDENEIDLVLGAPFINRAVEEAGKIGLFLEPLPIRISHAGNDVSDFLAAVRQASQRALAHQVPWSELVRHLGTSCAPPHNPFFDVMVAMHDLRRESLVPMEGMRQLQSWSTGSKFKLMVEISAFTNDQLLLRLEYDSNCFSEAAIERIHSLMLYALTHLPLSQDLALMRNSMASGLVYSNDKVQVGASI